jgi:hypothetical protein
MEWRAAIVFVANVAALGATASLEAAVRVDANRELRLLELGQTPPRRIPGAKTRVAVFTYEDPDRTGLGDRAAALMERAILTGSGASSLGVLRYEGDLSPRKAGDLGYFDKVERLLASQGASLAVWGRIARAGPRLLVDTYVQVPPEALASRFTWQVRLPRTMGGEKLLARLRPNRFAVQRLELPAEAGEALRASAERLDELRESPAESAAVTARLPKEQVYSLERREGEWVFLQVREGQGGWARAPACSDACGAFLSAAAFAGGLVGYLDGGIPPEPGQDVTPEALAVWDQLALDSLNEPRSVGRLMDLPQRGVARLGSRASVPAGGAAAANATALARVSVLLLEGFDAAYERIRPQLDSLRQQVREKKLEPPVGVALNDRAFLPAGPRGLSPLDMGLVYDQIEVSADRLREIAFDLADAAVLDPRNPELLHNLAVLFRRVGDTARATRAEQLARQATAR